MEASTKALPASLPGERVLVFDRYDHASPNGHERMLRAEVSSTNYNIAINSRLPSRDAIMKSNHNKRQLSRVFSTFNMGAAVTINTQDTGMFAHEEAKFTIISYVLQPFVEGKNGACALPRFRRVRASCVLGVEEPHYGQLPDADGALGWSGTQHQPGVH